MTTDRAMMLRCALAKELADNGGIASPEWREAFEAVPRHLFVPRFFLHSDGGGMRAVDSTDDEWLTKVYSDLTLVTQLDGDDTAWQRIRESGPVPGRPTSSSTQPVLMAWMLEVLSLRPGHQVLEIGTGTGYNAALLSHRLGEKNVTSIDLDGRVVQRARDALSQAGAQLRVERSDGLFGFPERAPYDRIIATCSFPAVPYSWIEQTKAGGLILTHLYTELDAGGLLLLSVHTDGTASGRFMPDYGAFMPRRDYPAPDTLALLQHALRDNDEGARSRTSLSANELTGNDFPLFAALRISGVAMHWFQPEGAPGMLTWLLGNDGSWAYQTVDDGGLVAVQSGERHLWNELTDAYIDWTAAGCPVRQQMGVSVAQGGGHRAWIDEPDGEWSWRLE